MSIGKTKRGLLVSVATLGVALILLLLPVFNQFHFCTDKDCETGKIAATLIQSFHQCSCDNSVPCSQDLSRRSLTYLSRASGEGSSAHCLFSAFIQDNTVCESTGSFVLLWNLESTVPHLCSIIQIFDSAFPVSPRAPPFPSL